MKKEVIRSIAVALDCSAHSRASLAAAAEMASRLQAELIGIFVEDMNLLRMAELPFIEEIRRYSSTTGKFDTKQLERLLRIQANEARDLLTRTAEKFTVHHTFRVLRGMVPAELMSAAPEADLLVLGRSGRSPSGHKGLGSTARTALFEGKQTILLMRPGFNAAAGPLLVLYDGSEGSKQALLTALGIAGPESTLQILITEPRSDAAEWCRQEAALMIANGGMEAQYHQIPTTSGHQLAHFIRMIDSGLLVLSDRMNLPLDTLRDLVSDLDYPVLIVRSL